MLVSSHAPFTIALDLVANGEIISPKFHVPTLKQYDTCGIGGMKHVALARGNEICGIGGMKFRSLSMSLSLT